MSALPASHAHCALAEASQPVGVVTPNSPEGHALLPPGFWTVSDREEGEEESQEQAQVVLTPEGPALVYREGLFLPDELGLEDEVTEEVPCAVLGRPADLDEHLDTEEVEPAEQLDEEEVYPPEAPTRENVLAAVERSGLGLYGFFVDVALRHTETCRAHAAAVERGDGSMAAELGHDIDHHFGQLTVLNSLMRGVA